MKKIAKILCFVGIFVFIFNAFQHIYHQRWPKYYNNYKKYEKMDDVDVVFIGTSELQAGVSPGELYQHSGITSYNLCHAYKSPITFYREAEYVINNKKPKYLAMDFASLFDEQLPQDREMIYRLQLYAIPDKSVKIGLLKDIWKYDVKEALSFTFPLLRFHGMWSQEEADFTPEYEEEASLDSLLGWEDFDGILISDTKGAEIEATADMWEAKPADEGIPEISRLYYDKLVELCRENDVQLIAVYPPNVKDGDKTTSYWSYSKDYFEANGILYHNYNTYEEWKRIGLDWDEDYYDNTHLNCQGAIKWSDILAEDLVGMGL